MNKRVAIGNTINIHLRDELKKVSYETGVTLGRLLDHSICLLLEEISNNDFKIKNSEEIEEILNKLRC